MYWLRRKGPFEPPNAMQEGQVMKAINLREQILTDAPEEWAKLPDIASQRPPLSAGEVELMRLGDTPVCAWYARVGLVWERWGDLFLMGEPS